jgi:hypothetical protein
MPVRTVDSIVANVGSNPFTAKSGKTYNSHYVITQDGDQIEVGLKAKYKIGDRFYADIDKKFGKLTEVGPPSGVPSKPSSAGVPAGDSNTKQARVFPIPELSGEMAIIRQNALTNAVNLINSKFSQIVGADKTKAEREQLADAYVEDVLRVAYKFADFSSGHREAKLARERARLSDTPSE